MTIAAVLAAIALQVPVPPGVTISTAPCPAYGPSAGVAACADIASRTIYMFPPGLVGRVSYKLTLAHELGHIWDVDNMTPERRMGFADQVGVPPDRPWLSGGDFPVGDPPAGERFADAYALCALTQHQRRRVVRRVGYVGVYGGSHLTHRVVSNVCWLLDHAPATSRR